MQPVNIFAEAQPDTNQPDNFLGIRIGKKAIARHEKKVDARLSIRQERASARADVKHARADNLRSKADSRKVLADQGLQLDNQASGILGTVKSMFASNPDQTPVNGNAPDPVVGNLPYIKPPQPREGGAVLNPSPLGLANSNNPDGGQMLSPAGGGDTGTQQAADDLGNTNTKAKGNKAATKPAGNNNRMFMAAAAVGLILILKK